MKKARLFHFLLAAALVLPGPVSGADGAGLPDLGDTSASVLSPHQERKLGEDFMRRARQVLTFHDDPEIAVYLQNLGQRLVAHSDGRQQEFRFFVVSDPTINAFAVPGGFVGVHTGLILAATNEAELASVLAHEIAHLTQRHIPRMIEDAKRTSLPAMAALLAAILLAGSNGQAGGAAVALTSAAMAQKGINFTRASEEEADRLGAELLASAGFDPRAMPAFFERMQALNRHNETNLPEFLRTHPVTSTRIAEARDRAERHPYRQTPDSVEFQHARAKIRAAASGDAAEIARGFAYNLEQGKYAAVDAERYGYVWALLRAHRFDTARAQVKKLIERQPGNALYRIAQAEIEMADRRYVEALTLYSAAYKKAPGYYPLERGYIRALLKTDRHTQAMRFARDGLKHQPDDPALYELLAQAAGGAGRRAEAHQAQAEYFYLNGNPSAALEQLALAGKFAGDNFYLHASVEARAQAIKDEVALYRGP